MVWEYETDEPVIFKVIYKNSSKPYAKKIYFMKNMKEEINELNISNKYKIKNINTFQNHDIKKKEI